MTETNVNVVNTNLNEQINCYNCLVSIPKENFQLHSVFCHRHLWKCELCITPIPITEKVAHMLLHEPIKCELCGENYERRLEADHLKIECTMREIECQFCTLMVSPVDIDSHQNQCGNRTERCALCDRYVRIKDFDQHQISNCSYPPSTPVHKYTAEENLDQLRAATLGDFFYLPTTQNHLEKFLLDQTESNENIDIESDSTSEEEDGEENAKQSEKKQRSPTRDTRNLISEYNGDYELIPCEICGDSFPFEVFVEHQVQCSSEKSSIIGGDYYMDDDDFFDGSQYIEASQPNRAARRKNLKKKTTTEQTSPVKTRKARQPSPSRLLQSTTTTTSTAPTTTTLNPAPTPTPTPIPSSNTLTSSTTSHISSPHKKTLSPKVKPKKPTPNKEIIENTFPMPLPVTVTIPRLTEQNSIVTGTRILPPPNYKPDQKNSLHTPNNNGAKLSKSPKLKTESPIKTSSTPKKATKSNSTEGSSSTQTETTEASQK